MFQSTQNFDELTIRNLKLNLSFFFCLKIKITFFAFVLRFLFSTILRSLILTIRSRRKSLVLRRNKIFSLSIIRSIRHHQLISIKLKKFLAFQWFKFRRFSTWIKIYERRSWSLLKFSMSFKTQRLIQSK